MNEFLREAAALQPGLRKSLETLHRRAEAAIEAAVIADTVLDARDLAGDSVGAAGSTGGSSSIQSAEATDPSAQSSLNPLRSLQAPDAYSVRPLVELELLSLRAAQILRKRHQIERRLSLAITGLTGIFVGLALVLAIAGRQLAPAMILIAGAAVSYALLRWRWRPYRRAAQSLYLIGLAEALSGDLRERLRSLERIPDHATRHLQQWQAVLELTAPVVGLSEAST